MKDDAEFNALIARMEDSYWWYTARRRILRDFIQNRMPSPAGARLLQAGCGAGSDSTMLAGLGYTVYNTDVSAYALACARSKGTPCLSAADAMALPFPDGVFEAVACLDVIEHIQQDQAALRELGRVLTPGRGLLLLTVPAFKYLWTSRDNFEGHYRRYNKAMLKERLEKAGLELLHTSCFFSFILPLALLDVLIDRLVPPRKAEAYFPALSPWLNRMLHRLTCLESPLVRRRGIHFGKSLLCLCRRTG